MQSRQLTMTPETDTSLNLKVQWIEADLGEGKGTATLCAGAGVGSPMMHLTVERPDKPTIRERIDIRHAFTDWIDSAIANADETGPA